MARRVFFAIALLPLLFALADSQDSTACLASLQTSLSGCLTYLTGSSTITPDQSTCCTPLTKVLNTPDDLKCICSLNSTSSSFYQRALSLPKACKLSIIVSDSNCTSSSTLAGSTPSTSSPSSSSSTSAATVGVSFPATPAACLLWPLVALLL